MWRLVYNNDSESYIRQGIVMFIKHILIQNIGTYSYTFIGNLFLEAGVFGVDSYFKYDLTYLFAKMMK